MHRSQFYDVQATRSKLPSSAADLPALQTETASCVRHLFRQKPCASYRRLCKGTPPGRGYANEIDRIASKGDYNALLDSHMVRSEFEKLDHGSVKFDWAGELFRLDLVAGWQAILNQNNSSSIGACSLPLTKHPRLNLGTSGMALPKS